MTMGAGRCKTAGVRTRQATTGPARHPAGVGALRAVVVTGTETSRAGPVTAPCRVLSYGHPEQEDKNSRQRGVGVPCGRLST